MNYGTAPYGSTGYGGSASSGEQVFLPYTEYGVGTHEGTAEFLGADMFYSVFARIASDAVEVNFQVFTRNNLSENPQSQVTFGGFGLFHQAVVGAARYIIVQATVPTSNQLFSVTGRPGD